MNVGLLVTNIGRIKRLREKPARGRLRPRLQIHSLICSLLSYQSSTGLQGAWPAAGRGGLEGEARRRQNGICRLEMAT